MGVWVEFWYPGVTPVFPYLKLRDKQWHKIFTAVLASGRCKNLKKTMAASTPESLQAALVVLQDDDSDLTDS